MRVVVVDFGCAVMRGAGPADMNDRLEVNAVCTTNITLGNQAHLAPEVLEVCEFVRVCVHASERLCVHACDVRLLCCCGVWQCVHARLQD